MSITHKSGLALPQASPSRRTLYALCIATALSILVLTELLVIDVALAWGAIGLWGIPELIAWIIGGAGALAASYVGLWLFRSAYQIERAG